MRKMFKDTFFITTLESGSVLDFISKDDAKENDIILSSGILVLEGDNNGHFEYKCKFSEETCGYRYIVLEDDTLEKEELPRLVWNMLIEYNNNDVAIQLHNYFYFDNIYSDYTIEYR